MSGGRRRGLADPADRPPSRRCADPDAIAARRRLLGKARRPLIVVGGGALGAGPEVQAIAELLQAPVSSFRRGRGVIPTTHPLAVSFTEGHGLWKTADAVLAIGTRLYWQQSNWGVDDGWRSSGWTSIRRRSAGSAAPPADCWAMRRSRCGR